ncbi:hypothetical protein C8R45DRAFT_1106635 [Mycena sanguinolenta]|nr:hypothetical protein C8R45DRAFT_1106635 [Mycena sanguinolenta]
MCHHDYMTENGNVCPDCGCQLIVETAVGGKAPGSHFIRCTNSGRHSLYFHRFPEPKPDNAQNAASSQSVPTPSTSVTLAPTTQARKCAEPRCNSGRVDLACPRHRCQRHCIAIGPCTLRSHERERLKKLTGTAAAIPLAPAPSSSSRKSSSSILPPVPSVPASTSRTSALSIPPPAVDFASYEDWMAQTLPPIEALGFSQQEDEWSFLDDLPGIKSPTPETESIRERYEREEREDAERLEHGLRLSQDEATRAAAGPSRLASQSFPMLRALSLSPTFPTRVLPPPQPRPAGSAPKKLCITTQLNSDWMGTSSTTLHVKNKAKATVSRRFIIVFWNEENMPHRVMCIEDVPSWPRWRASEATGILAALLGNNTKIDLFFQKYKSWVGIELEYVHLVSQDCIVMLRRRDVECYDFVATVRKFFPDSINILHNLPGERTALRRLYKRSGTTADKDKEDSDVEIVEELHQKRIKDEEDEEPARRQRPRLHINVDPDIIVIDDDAGTPPLTTATSASSSLAPSSPYLIVDDDDDAPLLAPPSSALLSAPPSGIRWPAGVHVVDMIAGFQMMDSPLLAGLSREERFKRAFSERYNASTLTDQRAILRSATAAEIKQGVSAGYTKDGLWTVWRKRLAAAGRR